MRLSQALTFQNQSPKVHTGRHSARTSPRRDVIQSLCSFVHICNFTAPHPQRPSELRIPLQRAQTAALRDRLTSASLLPCPCVFRLQNFGASLVRGLTGYGMHPRSVAEAQISDYVQRVEQFVILTTSTKSTTCAAAHSVFFQGIKYSIKRQFRRGASSSVWCFFCVILTPMLDSTSHYGPR